MNEISEMRILVNTLNKYAEAYYVYDTPIVSDKQYDTLYDRLAELEDITGIQLSNSPTVKVQGRVLDRFTKIEHTKPMLSAEKTKDPKMIERWLKGRKYYCSYKLDGCFTSKCRVLMADGSYKKINKVQVGDYVLSCSPEGIVQPKKVLNVFDNGLKKQNEWLTIHTERGMMNEKSGQGCKGGIKCTKNHMFFTENGYIKAEQLKVGDIIYKPHRTPSEIQQQVILGLLLGDGHFVKRTKAYSDLLEIHTSKTKNGNYDNIIYKLETMFKSFEPKITHKTSGYSNNQNNMTHINFHVMALPNYFNNENNQIRCGLTWTKEILEHMSPLSWAVFFIDDGSLVKSQEEGKDVTNKIAGAIFHTNRHSYENVKILSDYLNHIGIINYIEFEKPIINKEWGEGYVIRLSQDTSMDFFSMIAPYIPKEIRDKKLPNRKELQNCEEIKWWENDDSYIGLSGEKISKVVPCTTLKEHSLRAYDIEVEDNHNYFANNHLVHNCTLVLRYSNGKFIQAITRGNGYVGEDVTEQAKLLNNIPLSISYYDDLEVRGECICSWEEFNRINENIETPFSHPRNLAAGTIRNLDTNILKDRRLSFLPFECVTDIGVDDKVEILQILRNWGFEVVPFAFDSEGGLDKYIETMKAELCKYPVDGLIFELRSREESLNTESTAHHEGCRIALKWEDNTYTTTLTDIEWNTSRSGFVAPVAIFEPVDLDGATTSRATLHNVSIIENLKLGIGDKITVYKANMIIPAIDENLTKSNTYKLPTHCPACGAELEMRISATGTKNLYCNNPDCHAKFINKLIHYVSRSAMNIEGISEAIIEVLYQKGFVKNYSDLYKLSDYKSELIGMNGFGEKSYNNLINAIEKSKYTTLDRFIVAMGIPNVGKSAAKLIAKKFKGDFNKFVSETANGFDYTSIETFGEVINSSIHKWLKDFDKTELIALKNVLIFDTTPFETEDVKENPFSGKIIVPTGKLNSFTRDSINAKIESLGAKAASSVSKKTDYVLTNEASGSSKYKKAMELGIPVISEEQFLQMIGE